MRIFFSFSSRDMGEAAALVDVLRQKHDVFFSPDSIRHGAYWQPVLAEEVAKADAFVLLVAGDKPGPWQLPEYYTAFDRKVKQPDFPLVPIVAGGASAAFPFLAQINWIMTEGPLGQGTAAQIEAALGGKAEPPQQPWRHANPFQDLNAFDESHADLFFGREREIDQAVTMIAGQPDKLLALVGSSGTGKSSLVKAGVMAALRRQHLPDEQAHWPSALKQSRNWLYIGFAPGEAPISKLVEAFFKHWRLGSTDPDAGPLEEKWIAGLLSGRNSIKHLCDASFARFRELGYEPPGGVFLYIDQGEEIYRAGAQETRRFSELVSEALSLPTFRCMLSLRSDHYGLLQADMSLWPTTQVLDVPPLSDTQLADVMRKAAGALKARFASPSMPDEIAATAANQPGALPLLSVYLSDMWKQMQAKGDGILRIPETAITIDIASVLKVRGESYIHDNPSKVDLVRRLFVSRLVRVPKDGPPLRKRALLSSLSTEEQEVAAAFTRQDLRLLVTSDTGGEPTLEVAHEALFSAWDRLKNWIAERREFLEWKDGFDQDRKAWEAEPRKRNLLMGGKLYRAKERLEKDADGLDGPDMKFISLGLAANRWRQIRNTAALASIIGLLAILFIGGFIFLDRTRTALEESLRNESLYIAATSDAELRKGNATLALKIALEAVPKGTARKNNGWFFHSPHALASWLDQTAIGRNIEPKVALALGHAYQKSISMNSNIMEHDDKILFSIFSPIRNIIATGSAEGILKIWDQKNNNKLLIEKDFDGAITNADFSTDGKYLALSSTDNTAFLINTNSGKQIGEAISHDGIVWDVDFSIDGNRFVTASADRTARIWSAREGAPLGMPMPHEATVTSAEFSPDGKLIVTASDDGTARIWSGLDGTPLGEPMTHRAAVNTAKFSPDGTQIVTASDDGTARLWSAVSGSPIGDIMVHASHVNFADFSPDGTKVITVSDDKTARLWNAKTGAPLYKVIHENKLLSASFSKDGNYIIINSFDTVEIRNTKDLGIVFEKLYFDGKVSSSYFIDNNNFAISSWEGKASIFSFNATYQEKLVFSHSDAVRTAVFSPDSMKIMTSSSNSKPYIWDVKAGRNMGEAAAHEYTVSALFSHDGLKLITGSADHTARIWSTITKNILIPPLRFDATVWFASFSYDNLRVVTASDEKNVHVWDSINGKLLLSIDTNDPRVRSAVFSPDGTYIVTASRTGARIWNASTGRQVGNTMFHNSDVNFASFSPDGSRIISASDDKTAIIWKTSNQEKVIDLVSHQGNVKFADFSRDGARVVTTSSDGTAQIWDAYTGTPVGSPLVHQDKVNFANFSPDGTELVTASDDGTARIWDASETLETFIARIRREIRSCLTAEERARYGLPPREDIETHPLYCKEG